MDNYKNVDNDFLDNVEYEDLGYMTVAHLNECIIDFYGEKKVEVMIDVDLNESKRIDKIQKETFNSFQNNIKDISKEILNTILDYYNNEEKYTYGPENIEERKIWWPNIETIDEMQKYIELEAIIIPPTSQMTDIFKGRCIYITFSKKWGDPDFDEDGIGVQIINEKVTKIGYRDIAF
jgi:hypothetical protein